MPAPQQAHPRMSCLPYSKLAALKEYDAELRGEGFVQADQTTDQDCIFLRAVVLHLLDANHDGQMRLA